MEVVAHSSTDGNQLSEFGDFSLDMNWSKIEMYDDIDIHYHDNVSDPLYWSPAYKAVGFSFGFIVLFTGLYGNFGVIATVWRSPSLFFQNGASATCRFIFCLAVADILVLLSSALPHMIELFLILNQWVYGRAGCSVLVFMQYLSKDVGGLCLLVIAAERYLTICYPEMYKVTIKRANIIILGIFMVVCAFCSPWLVLTKTVAEEYVNDQGSGLIIVEECTFSMSSHTFAGYYLADTIIFYLIPVLTCAVLYLQSRLKMSKIRVPLDRMKEDSRKQVFQMMMLATAAFGFLMIPYRGLILYNLYMPEKYYNMWLFLATRILVYVASAAKPIIYVVCSYQFRRAFRNVVCCRNNEDDNLNFELQATTQML